MLSSEWRCLVLRSITVILLAVSARALSAQSVSLSGYPTSGVAPFQFQLYNTVTVTYPQTWTEADLYMSVNHGAYTFVEALQIPGATGGVATWTATARVSGLYDFYVVDQGNQANPPYQWGVQTNVEMITAF